MAWSAERGFLPDSDATAFHLERGNENSIMVVVPWHDRIRAVVGDNMDNNVQGGSWGNSRMDKEERRGEGRKAEVVRLLFPSNCGGCGDTSETNCSTVERRDGTAADRDDSCKDPIVPECMDRRNGSRREMAACSRHDGHSSYCPLGCLVSERSWEHCALHNDVEAVGCCTTVLLEELILRINRV